MSMNEISEKILVERIKSGDLNASEELMERYKNNLFNFIFRMILDYQTAEDIFQETWLKVIAKIGKYNSRYQFKTWLFTISRNLCLDTLRKTRRRKMKQKFLEPGIIVPLNDLDVYGGKLSRVLSKTSPKLREAIILRFFHQYDLKEISQILGISVGTVKSRLNRGINFMKKIWCKES